MATGKALEMEYEDAKGQLSTRVIAPYGTFSFRERLYVVGPQVERDGTVVLDAAACAISVVARPTAQEELVASWRKQLEGVVRNG